jgi:pyridoxal phosphate enzyme (YggS family)
MNIASNLQTLWRELPQNVRLVAVSKFHPAEVIQEAYDAGQRIFGESRAQELTMKYEALPKDIEWHFIGTLQTNKVKYIAPFVSLIHSIDTYKLLEEVNRQAEKNNRTIDCLLQLHVAQEETKFGFTVDECREMLTAGEWRKLNHIRLCGIMGMGSNTDNEAQVLSEFGALHDFFCAAKEEFFASQPAFKELSMGMSHDYRLAIKAGSTMVRVGSKIFGERAY